MQILKRDGSKQQFSPDKIMSRISSCSKGLSIDVDTVFKSVIPSVEDGMNTTEMDELLAFKIADFIQDHPDYSILASRILITRQGKLIGVVPEEVDMSYDFFGTVTFLKKYSTKTPSETPLELPSMMYNRVADFFADNEKDRLEFREELKSKRISVATPILTNTGTNREAYISCNITTNISDSSEGILETLNNISLASREGAGIGLNIDNLRSSKSNVSSFNGKAGGVIRYADMVQSHMRFFRQGTRSGSAALYLSLWHKDIRDFLNLKLPIGDEKLRARDIFTAVIVNDNFMNALLNNEDWYLFCPKDIADNGLKPFQDIHGKEYEAEYNKAVALGIGEKIDPKVIWDSIIKSQAESGMPYTFYKDNANKKNMQDNIGTIKSSNLCIEFLGVSDSKYTSQCDLGLINLAAHTSLKSIEKSAGVLTRLLNRVIDKNKWQDDPSEKAGNHQRAIGIGIGGLADFFAIKDLPFVCDESKKWNVDIQKAIYMGAITESNRLAVESNKSYPAWKGSKYENGETYIDGWSPVAKGESIMMLNSILCCLMPSAGTSILLGVNECFEPFGSNLQVRNTGAGEFLQINKYLVRDFEKLGIWNDHTKSLLIQNGGSVQDMPVTDHIKNKYKTVWEISQKSIISMAADRAKYIDQSQSMNLYFENSTYGKISGALKYAWEQGLKTGSYYIKTEKRTEKPTRLTQMSVDTTASDNSNFECFGCSS